MSHGLARGALHLGAGTVVSRLLGLVRVVGLAWVVGTVGSRAADAFAIANQLPNNVFWLISSGVFAAVLVPQTVRASRHADGGTAHINRLLTIGLCVLTAVTVVALCLAPWLIELYAAGWEGEQLELATSFALWCLPQIVFYGIFSLVGEVLNAQRRFGPAAWAPLANNAVSLLGLAIFAIAFGVFPSGTGSLGDWQAPQVALLGGTATLGVAIQAGLVAVAWRASGARFRLDFRWRQLDLAGISKTAGWTFAIVLVGQLLGVIQSRITTQASGIGASAFATSTAWLMFMLPYSIVAVTIATVFFTRFSELGAAGRLSELSSDVASAGGMLIVTMVGATGAMMLIALPAGRVLTDSVEAARAMALLLAAYLVGLVPFALLLLTHRAFYALGDARTPFIYTCVQAAVVAVGTLVVPLVVPAEYLATGVAGVQSAGTCVQVITAVVLLRKRLRATCTRGLGASAGRSVAALVPAALGGGLIASWAVGVDATGWAMTDRVLALLAAALIGFTFTLLYAVALWLQGEPATRRLVAGLRNR